MVSTNDQPTGNPAPCNESKLAGREASFAHWHFCDLQSGHQGQHRCRCGVKYDTGSLVRAEIERIKEQLNQSLLWVRSEENGEVLWGRIRNSTGANLRNLWRQGELVGRQQEEAFFVKCDRSTMTQQDVQEGVVVVLVGVAIVRPAEFEIIKFELPTTSTPH